VLPRGHPIEFLWGDIAQLGSLNNKFKKTTRITTWPIDFIEEQSDVIVADLGLL